MLPTSFISGFFSFAYLLILGLIVYATFYQDLTYFMAAGSAIFLTVLYIPFAFFLYRKEHSFFIGENIESPRTPPKPVESPLKHLADVNRIEWTDEEKHKT